MPELLGEVSTLGHAPRVIGVYRRADLPAGSRDVVLALWRVADPGNVGTLCGRPTRSAPACRCLPECADPTGPRALRASAGAIFRVPLVAWDELPARGSRSSHTAASRSPMRRSTPPLTLLLGSEREGLPADLATDCHKATIRLPGDAESLNVAAAGAIALYELARRATA